MQNKSKVTTTSWSVTNGGAGAIREKTQKRSPLISGSRSGQERGLATISNFYKGQTFPSPSRWLFLYPFSGRPNIRKAAIKDKERIQTRYTAYRNGSGVSIPTLEGWIYQTIQDWEKAVEPRGELGEEPWPRREPAVHKAGVAPADLGKNKASPHQPQSPPKRWPPRPMNQSLVQNLLKIRSSPTACS
ncbi:hypothetical protein HPB47_017567 [Ixodes persulcatus]|uniref:Uncharacterized protein n=1 Tax=Ixodes persulcatus TaxID=34615 RepID=A0AC60QMZ0_IXOPE|nr:hypothetical protein HPB47_017567 [Ixodes persulcatus]